MTLTSDLQEFECKITSLQEQVERYSMMSSMTPEDFEDEEDTFGLCLLTLFLHLRIVFDGPLCANKLSCKI